MLGIGIAAFALGFMFSLDNEQYFAFLGRMMVAVIPTIFVMFIVSRPS